MSITKVVSVGLLGLVAVLGAAAPDTFSAGGASAGATTIASMPGPGGAEHETVVETFEVVAPSGNTVYGLIRRPDPALYGASSYPAVIFIPGGINPGRLDALGDPEVIRLAEAGMVAVTFNAEGRGDVAHGDQVSEGSEDYNGFRHQDGLAAIVRHVAGLDYVIAGNIGLRTQSFGITMAAGCVARHPDLPVKYIVDGEGPSESFVTAQEPWALFSDPSHPFHDKYLQVYEILGHFSTYRDPSPENVAFWSEREADRFIGSFRGRYLRLQATWDHSQPPGNELEVPTFHVPPLWWQGKHTADMVNAAVSGGVPWVRVNLPEQGNPVNMTYDADNQPVFLPGELKDRFWAEPAVLEMAFASFGEIPPAVMTIDAAPVTATRAALNADLVGKGSSATVLLSFEWGPAGHFTSETAPFPARDGGPFSADLAGLVPGATYQFRAKAIGDGTSYGIKKTFTTRIPDPDTPGGFVTGGGWIACPTGACGPDPSLAGKATFGFVAKYVRGAAAPTGHAEFQFRAGRFDFRSSSIDWLVLDEPGTTAEVHGSGTVNGAGGFAFTLWAGDGITDTLRMRIWQRSGEIESVYFDNGFGQPIGGGSIVIHAAK